MSCINELCFAVFALASGLLLISNVHLPPTRAKQTVWGTYDTMAICFHDYQERNIKPYRRSFHSVCWQNNISNMNVWDIARDDNNRSTDVEGLAAAQIKHLLSYTKVRFMAAKTFNLIEPIGLDPLATWIYLIMETLHSISVHRIPVLTGHISIANNGTLSSPNVGTLLRKGTKSRRRVWTEKERERRSRLYEKRGWIMRSEVVWRDN